jgi:predicted PurR-regulated permease PerM
MDDSVFRAVGEFGATTTLFVIFMLGLFWAIFRYIPKAWEAHINLIKEMQNKFSEDLANITAESALTNKGFLDQIEIIHKDHEQINISQIQQIKILEKLDKKQDNISDEILKHNVKCKHQK